jgi:hypothetical protein
MQGSDFDMYVYSAKELFRVLITAVKTKKRTVE